MLNVLQVLLSKTALPKIFGKSKLWAPQPYESLCVCQTLKISVIPISAESTRNSNIIARHRESVRDHHFTEFIAGICLVFYV